MRSHRRRIYGGAFSFRLLGERKVLPREGLSPVNNCVSGPFDLLGSR